jgi:hypothetical protein
MHHAAAIQQHHAVAAMIRHLAGEIEMALARHHLVAQAQHGAQMRHQLLQAHHRLVLELAGSAAPIEHDVVMAVVRLAEDSGHQEFVAFGLEEFVDEDVARALLAVHHLARTHDAAVILLAQHHRAERAARRVMARHHAGGLLRIDGTGDAQAVIPRCAIHGGQAG